MNRRHFLIGTGATSTAALAGCMGSDDSDNGDDDDEPELPEQPDISAVDSAPDEPETTLEIRWNATVYDDVTLDPDDDDQHYTPDEGEHYLIVQAELSNVGEEWASVGPGDFGVEADGEEREWIALDDEDRMNLEVQPDNSEVDFVTFTVPEGTDEVEIIAPLSEFQHWDSEFTHDEGLEMDVYPA